MNKRKAEYDRLMNLSRYEIGTVRFLGNAFNVETTRLLVALTKKFPGVSFHDGSSLSKAHLKELKPVLLASDEDLKSPAKSSLRRLPQIDWSSLDDSVRKRRKSVQREIEKWYASSKEDGAVRLRDFLLVVKYGETSTRSIAKCLGFGNLVAGSVLNLHQYKKLAGYLPIYGDQYVKNNSKWINEIIAGHPHY